MPGPQFSADPNGSGWLGRHWRKTIIILTLALMFTGAAYFYQSYQTRTALLRPVLEQITASPSPTASIKAQLPTTSSKKIENATSPASLTEQNNGQITVTAAKGNGVTHLARQALKEYLKDKPKLAQRLGTEQRIYIEDYLRKHLASQPKTLRVGDQLTFSDNDIQSAVNQALALSDDQIKNLNKYVPLVPSLMTP